MVPNYSQLLVQEEIWVSSTWSWSWLASSFHCHLITGFTFSSPDWFIIYWLSISEPDLITLADVFHNRRGSLGIRSSPFMMVSTFDLNSSNFPPPCPGTWQTSRVVMWRRWKFTMFLSFSRHYAKSILDFSQNLLSSVDNHWATPVHQKENWQLFANRALTSFGKRV